MASKRPTYLVSWTPAAPPLLRARLTPAWARRPPAPDFGIELTDAELEDVDAALAEHHVPVWPLLPHAAERLVAEVAKLKHNPIDVLTCSIWNDPESVAVGVARAFGFPAAAGFALDPEDGAVVRHCYSDGVLAVRFGADAPGLGRVTVVGFTLDRQGYVGLRLMVSPPRVLALRVEDAAEIVALMQGPCYRDPREALPMLDAAAREAFKTVSAWCDRQSVGTLDPEGARQRRFGEAVGLHNAVPVLGLVQLAARYPQQPSTIGLASPSGLQ